MKSEPMALAGGHCSFLSKFSALAVHRGWEADKQYRSRPPVPTLAESDSGFFVNAADEQSYSTCLRTHGSSSAAPAITLSMKAPSAMMPACTRWREA